MLNPTVRYVMNSDQLEHLNHLVDTCSDLRNSAFHKPLNGLANLAQKKILVERYRGRGVGDLLFMTGPLNYIRHISGHSAKIEFYALAERSQVLQLHPALAHKSTLAGPLIYDTINQYDYQWFSDCVTEYDEEKDQLNVYDALFKQIGIDPQSVGAEFKRPSIHLDEQDFANLDTFYYFVYGDRHIDLRKTGYYVVAPLSNGTLRSLPYASWLEIISELSKKRPVVVIGQMSERVPPMDMTGGEFYSQVNQLAPNVINAMGNTQLRVVSAIIARATGVVCLDSGPLYISQALRTPAISIWGPHHPGVRIGYDKDYMELAIWNSSACSYAPCFAYHGFPTQKCPQGDSQRICEVLKVSPVESVINKLEKIESGNPSVTSFKAAKPTK